MKQQYYISDVNSHDLSDSAWEIEISATEGQSNTKRRAVAHVDCVTIRGDAVEATNRAMAIIKALNALASVEGC